MSRATPQTDRLIAAIRARRRVTSHELFELTGVTSNNQLLLLAPAIAAGTVKTGHARVRTGKYLRRVRSYEWAGEGDAMPTQPNVPRPPSPQEAGMRRCLGMDCGRTFQSKHAGNRLCPACASASARRSGAGAFDTPAIVRYR